MVDPKGKARRGVGRRTTRPYVWLYNAMNQNLERMKEEEGSFYEALQGLMSAAFLVESYLNTVGEQLFRDWDAKPAKGKSKAFQSIPEKLKLILREMDCYSARSGTSYTERIDPGSDKRHSSLSQVTSFRTAIAHGREETVSGEWHSIDGEAGMRGLESDWERLLEDGDKVRVLCTDCVSLVKTLNKMLREAGRTDIAPYQHPFFSAASAFGWVDEGD